MSHEKFRIKNEILRAQLEAELCAIKSAIVELEDLPVKSYLLLGLIERLKLSVASYESVLD